MSLGTWKSRSTKYQRFLNISNVFLLITSTILIFSSIVLIKFYHISKLDFWSQWFYINPMLMIALGLYTFLVCVYGFLISNQENRCYVSLIAVFLSVAFLGQIFSVFTAMELRNKINNKLVNPGEVLKDMGFYGQPDHEDVTSKWDELQREMRCCGGLDFDYGYQSWGKVAYGVHTHNVPDSCCHEETEGCGYGKALKRAHEMSGIYKDGCIAILKIKVQHEVEPLMIVYACIGVVIALVEMITIVLACAYVAQIGRRRRRDEIYTRAATAAGVDEEYLPSLSKETNF